MSFEQVARNLPAPIIAEFKRAVASGSWKNGKALTGEQKRICQCALFFHQHLKGSVH